MCGIAGVLQLDGAPVEESVVVAMNRAQAHRGPDDEGAWVSGPAGLGHRRLSIIDLSELGHQPMTNETGDVWITYSGELYNYVELRHQLEAAGHRFRSRTDTEVIVHAYEEWGEGCLDRFNGHFSFAIWDGRRRRLFAARDRFGVRPLYYATPGRRLLFATEVKSILAHPGVRREVCHEALDEYFTFQNVLSDLTLFEGVRLLPPGCFLTAEVGDSEPTVRRYWDYRFPEQPLAISESEAAEELFRLFEQAVRRQLMSDVPLGSYLSGGMDSGSITSVARRHLGRLTTFTGGFDLSSASGLELGFDERANSEFLANLLKTEHYEVILHAGDMENVMPELVWHLEDLRVGQCYPNYYVAKLASRFVKVVLSGAGGDELFAGYPWRYYHGIAAAGGSVDDYHHGYYEFWQRLVPDDEKRDLFNAATAARIGESHTFETFRGLIAGSGIVPRTLDDCINASLYFELRSFLHGLLVVEDKISFAHGLETRAPFLDNDLVDFALALPLKYKLRHPADQQRMDEDEVGKLRRYELETGDGKQVLRKAMRRLIPEEVTRRRKQGFSAPDASWFRGESIDYINRILRDPKARLYDFIQPGYVARRLDEHSSGRVNHRLFIWSLLSFEWWLRGFAAGRYEAAPAAASSAVAPP